MLGILILKGRLRHATEFLVLEGDNLKGLSNN